MRCRNCNKSQSGFLDESLDESQTTPKLLRRLQYLSEEMSYQRAERYLEECELKVSSSHLAELSQSYEATQEALVAAKLSSLETEPLSQSQAASRVWMLEVDGMMAPTRGEENTIQGKAEYKEVKSALLYLKNTPSERYQISSFENCQKFAPLVHGMLRTSGVRRDDVIVGLADGARWITTLFGDIGVDKHILDVYHASSYLETVMLGLEYSQETRQGYRKQLLAGEFDMQTWLNQHITPQAREKVLVAKNPTTQTGTSRSPKEALHYLEQHAMLNRMDYCAFKAQGFEVIGSGEIEGANKNVLAARLKVSGARWGSGGQGKAMARAMSASVRPVFDFDSIRLSAFPKPW
jgi:hypothetical protein